MQVRFLLLAQNVDQGFSCLYNLYKGKGEHSYMVKWYHRALIRLYLEFDSRFSYKNTEGTTAACHSALKADMHEQSWGIDTSIFRLIYSDRLMAGQGPLKPRIEVRILFGVLCV